MYRARDRVPPGYPDNVPAVHLEYGIMFNAGTKSLFKKYIVLQPCYKVQEQECGKYGKYIALMFLTE